MGTRFRLRDIASPVVQGSETEKQAITVQGSAAVTKVTSTTGGPTSGVQLTDGAGGAAIAWYTDGIRGGGSLVGSPLIVNIYALESANQANTGLDVELRRTDQFGNDIEQIARGERGTELGTSSTAQTYNITPVGTINFNHGDRIKIIIYGNDAGGNMGNGRTFSVIYGAGAGVSGDSYIDLNLQTVAFGSNGFGQAQTKLKGIGQNFGQAQVHIAYTSATDTFTRTVVTDLGQTDSGATWATVTSNASVDGSKAVFNNNSTSRYTLDVVPPSKFMVQFSWIINGWSDVGLNANIRASNTETQGLGVDISANSGGVISWKNNTSGLSTGYSVTPVDGHTINYRVYFNNTGDTSTAEGFAYIWDEGVKSLSSTTVIPKNFNPFQTIQSNSGFILYLHVGEPTTQGIDNFYVGTWKFEGFGQAQASISASSTTIYAADDFNDPGTDTWNSLDIGGSWSNSGTASDYQKTGTEGTHSVGAATTRQSRASSVSAGEQEGNIEFKVADITGTGQGIFWRIETNGDATFQNGYRFEVRIANTGAVAVLQRKVASGSATTVRTDSNVLTGVSANDWLHFKWQLDFSGADIILRYKMWNVTTGGTEPGLWSTDLTDTAPGSPYTDPGIFQITSQTTVNFTGSTPVLFSYRGLTITSIPSGATTVNAYGQAQADIKQIGRGYGQSQTDIKTTSRGLAQAQGDIKAISQRFAQSQADIKAISRGFGQSRADIQQTYTQFGQALAFVGYTNAFDTYTRSVTDGIGTADSGGPYDIDATSNVTDFDVDGSSLVISNAGDPSVVTAHNVYLKEIAYAPIYESSIDFSIPNLPAVSNYWLGIAQGKRVVGNNSRGYGFAIRISSTGNITYAFLKGGTAATFFSGPTNTYVAGEIWTFKLYVYTTSSRVNFAVKLWKVGTIEPFWQAFNVATIGTSGEDGVSGLRILDGFTDTGQGVTTYTLDNLNYINSTALVGLGQAQTKIKSVGYGLAQAQANIQAFITTRIYAQAQSDIRQTYYSLAQSQADIKTVGTGLGQANSDIKAINSGLGQTQAWIEATGSGLGQSQADIKAAGNGVGQAQSDIRTTYNSYAQSQADIKAVGRGLGQAQAAIRQTYRGLGQTQADIKAIGRGLAQAQADIKAVGRGLAQGQADIKATSNGLAQSQATIKAVGSGLAQAQADIKAINNGLGQANSDIKQTYNQFAQAQADIKIITYGFAQTQVDIKQTYTQCAQAQVNIKQTYRGHAQANASILGAQQKYGQAQATILQAGYGSGNAQADIKQAYNSFGQSQADVKQTYNGYGQAQAAVKGNAFGQTQADIKATYYGLAQTQAQIKTTYNQFGQAQARLATVYSQCGQAQANVKATSNGLGQTQADIKTTYKVFAQAQADIKQRYNGFGQSNALIVRSETESGQAQADVKSTYNGFAQAQARVLATSNGYGQAQATVQGNVYGQAQGYIKVVNISAFAQVQAAIKTAGYGLGQSQAYIRLVGISRSGQANADIKASYAQQGQAQSEIKQTYYSLAQTQASIKQTYKQFAQAQADILTVSYGLAQAQADILSTYYGSALTQADIKHTYNFFGQSQTSIKTVSNGFGQSQVDIKATSQEYAQAQAKLNAFGQNAFGQAQTNIRFNGTVGAGQAQAKIKAFGQVICGQTQARVRNTYLQSANTQTDIKAVSNGFGNVQTDIKQSYISFAQAQTDIVQTYSTPAQAQGYIKIVGLNGYGQSQVDIKATSSSFGQAQGYIGTRNAGYGQSQGSIKSIYSALGQSQTDIKQTYIKCAQVTALIRTTAQGYGQAQGIIKVTSRGYGQAQAAIRVVVVGQSQADILHTYIQSGSAQALIRIGVINVAQTQAAIRTTYNTSGQAAATIQSGYFGIGLVQAVILTIVSQYGQASAFVVKASAFAQAAAYIRQLHQLKSLTISDRLALSLEVSARLPLSIGEVEGNLSLDVYDVMRLSLTVSDTVRINEDIKDINY